MLKSLASYWGSGGIVPTSDHFSVGSGAGSSLNQVRKRSKKPSFLTEQPLP